MKIISLAPTQTEIVAALGAVGDLLGITEDCDYPDSVLRIPRFGSWYSPDIRAITKAKPDLVLTFGSHQREVQGVLKDFGLNVYHSEPPTIAAALDTFRDISSIIGRSDECRQVISSLEGRLELFERTLNQSRGADDHPFFAS